MIKIGRLELSFPVPLPKRFEWVYFGKNKEHIYGRIFHFTYWYERKGEKR